MFSIGEFARLGGVSARTLRHYDEIGLLRPTTVDPDTGYRGYTAAQLGQLSRIVALSGRSPGFAPEVLVPVVNQLEAQFDQLGIHERVKETGRACCFTSTSTARTSRSSWRELSPGRYRGASPSRYS